MWSVNKVVSILSGEDQLPDYSSFVKEAALFGDSSLLLFLQKNGANLDTYPVFTINYDKNPSVGKIDGLSLVSSLLRYDIMSNGNNFKSILYLLDLGVYVDNAFYDIAYDMESTGIENNDFNLIIKRLPHVDYKSGRKYGTDLIKAIEDGDEWKACRENYNLHLCMRSICSKEYGWIECNFFWPNYFSGAFD